MELSRLIQHPEEMNKETLYDLRALLALHPYYQTARLLMLQNLYLLHDSAFDEELRQAAIYITDRKTIFRMIEAAHYQLKTETKKKEKTSAEASANASDRTSSLIDTFLESIPSDAEDEEQKNGKKTKRQPTPADAAVDYVAYLLETEDAETDEGDEEKSSRTLDLIDGFMDDGGFQLPKLENLPESTGSSAEPASPAEPEQEASTDEASSGGIFTETLARIYIKQGKYDRALTIIERLHNKQPQKSAYYTDQMRFLEKLIINSKNNNK